MVGQRWTHEKSAIAINDHPLGMLLAREVVPPHCQIDRCADTDAVQSIDLLS